VIGHSFGRNEGGHGFVGHRALRPFRLGEQAGHHAATGAQDPGRLGQGPARVAGELEGVDAGHGVKRGVGEREGLHVAVAQVCFGDALAGDGQEAGADVEAGRDGAALGGQDEGEAGAAADVEQAGAGADAGGVEDRLEQGLIVGFGQVGPGLGVGAPQAALDLGGRANRGHGIVAGSGPLAAGVMFWLRRKVFSGS
jgi:hypothetical protein